MGQTQTTDNAQTSAPTIESCCIRGSLPSGPAGSMAAELLDKSCGPLYTGPLSPGCSPHFKKYCQSGIWEPNSDCAKWAGAFKAESYPEMKIHCGLNPLSDECKTWGAEHEADYRTILGNYCTASRLGSEKEGPSCRERCRDYRGACNPSAEEYCRQASHDARFCSCFDSPVRIGPPECLDNQCAVYGYKTVKREDLPDCNLTVCQAFIDVNRVGRKVEITDTSIIQKCGEGAVEEEDVTEPTGGEEDDVDEDDEGDDAGEDEEIEIALGEIKTAEDFKQWAQENKEIVALFSIAALAIIVMLLLRD